MATQLDLVDRYDRLLARGEARCTYAEIAIPNREGDEQLRQLKRNFARTIRNRGVCHWARLPPDGVNRIGLVVLERCTAEIIEEGDVAR